MKKIINFIDKHLDILVLVFMLLFAVICIPTCTAQVVRDGNTFSATKTTSTKSEPEKTSYTYKDSKGVEYPIYISSTGSCFIIKISKKTDKEYRQYLGPEISSQICKELNREYKPKTSTK